MAKIKIGLISRIDCYYLGRCIKGFLNEDIVINAIFFDSKNLGAKGLALHEERTEGKMPAIPIYEYEECMIPSYFVKNICSDVSIKMIKKLGIDLLINTGTGRVLKLFLLNAPKIGVINWHPSLLPEFRGCTAVEWAIYSNKKVGNTVHFMNEKIDEGPIIMQEQIMISKDDVYSDVRVKIEKAGIELLAKATRLVIDKQLNPENLPSQPNKGSYFSIIDDEKLAVVKKILEEGKYRYAV